MVGLPAIKHINSELLSLASGVVIPLLTALLTKLHASGTLKAVLNAALAAGAGAITTATAAGGDVVWQTWLLDMALAFVGTITADFGFVSPTGIKGVVDRHTARIGIGHADTRSGTGTSNAA